MSTRPTYRRSGVGAPASAESGDSSRIRIMSPDDAARVILHEVENDQYHIYVNSRLMNLMNRVAHAVPLT